MHCGQLLHPICEISVSQQHAYVLEFYGPSILQACIYDEPEADGSSVFAIDFAVLEAVQSTCGWVCLFKTTGFCSFVAASMCDVCDVCV